MDLNAATTTTTTTTATAPAVVFEVYDTSESQLPQMMALIDSDLSEPYSVFTYRYFLRMSPSVSFVARDPALPAGSDVIGTVICKLESHRDQTLRGYIAMLAVAKPYRKHGIGSELVKRAVTAMRNQDADEAVLETELTNKAALSLYQRLGFVRDKRLTRYYLNGVDAFRLKCWLK